MTITTIPSIPNVTQDPADLEKALKAVKEIIQVREGRLGDTKDAFVSYRDLLDYVRNDPEVVAALATDIKLYDTNDSNFLSLIWNEDDTSDRILNLLVHGATRSLDLYENLKILDGQDIELHASGGEKAQLAIDTQNAERTLDLSENLTIADGYNVTVQALGQANSLILNESLTIGNGHSGTLTFSAASKVLTVDESATLSAKANLAGPTFTGTVTVPSTNFTVGTQVLTQTNLTDLLDGGDTTLHDHDGISENTGARHTQGTDTTLGTMTADIDMDGSYQVVGLQAPAAAGEALRQTVNITEADLETLTDGSDADALHAHDTYALESILGTSIGAGLLLDTTVLKTSAILQKYHAIDPAANVQSFLGAADYAAMMTLLSGEATATFSFNCQEIEAKYIWLFSRTTDNATKAGQVLHKNWDSGTETEGWVAWYSYSAETVNTLSIGGNDPGRNAATLITFYTAADPTTRQGTKKMDIDSSGNIDIVSHDAATVGLQLSGVLVTASAVELNILDGVTSTTAEINALDGISANGTGLIQAADYAAMLALLSGTATAAFDLNAQNLTGVGTVDCGAITSTGSLIAGTSDPINGSDYDLALSKYFTIWAVSNTENYITNNLYYDAAAWKLREDGSASYVKMGAGTFDIQVGGAGSKDGDAGLVSALLIDSSGNVDINAHNAGSVGLKLGSTLVTASAVELNLNDGAAYGVNDSGGAGRRAITVPNI